MEFSEFCKYLSKLESISSRLQMIEELNSVFKKLKKLDEDEVKKAMYLLQGGIAPGYVGVKFNVNNRTVDKVLKQLYGEEEVKKEYSKLGDYGDVFAAQNRKRGSKKTTTGEIYMILSEIAAIGGTGSVARKEEKIKAGLSKLNDIQGK